ncbi:MAG: hypothetical protein IJT83_15545, partial [Victivallales bacterium]|nr:hypothetical protein [Victivallales bacterium]
GYRFQFYAYDWYPGWDDWGFAHSWFDGYERNNPEEVLHIEGNLLEDGSFSTMVDTATAGKLAADCVQFNVTAEVRDKSRRIITGKGSFKVSQKSFRIFTWLDRGFLFVGDKATAFMEARSVDGNPVNGNGKMTLLRISYDNAGKPTETLVCEWDASFKQDGKPLEYAFSCSEPGQYRLACQLTEEDGQTVENGLIFSVMGAGSDGRAFHYNGLELLTDKENYSPGETVRLLINTEQADSTVMLFVRAEKGKVPLPQVLHLNGKSQIVEIPVGKEDMPNFFVEAYTLANGELYESIREIVLPPLEKTLNVEVRPGKKSFLPGEKGSIELQITDLTGKPVHGSLVVTVYDKSLEAISPCRILGISKAFWGWSRSHRIVSCRFRNFHDSRAYFYFNKPMDDLDGDCYCVTFNDLDYDNGYESNDIFAGAPIESPSFDLCMPACPDEPASPEELIVEEDEETLATPVLRTHFADTALWAGQLETDEQGRAMVKLTLPDDLTTWKIRVWSMGEGTCVGEGTAEVKTAKNLLVRLQSPRFFVERDEVVISANVHNYLANSKKVMAELELDGGCLEHLAEARQTVEVPSQGEARLDWRVKAVREGTAVIRVKALTDEESDAVEKSYPVHVHGIDKLLSSSLSMRQEETHAKMAFDVPTERRRETTRLEIRWSPSLALSMVDALPYLLEYPYGCTEQTLNRFLPALQCKMLLDKMAVKLADIKSFTQRLDIRAEALQELLRNGGKEVARTAWDDEMLADIVDCCIDKLRSMRCYDGGWGWFSGLLEYSGPHTTAQVVQGLLAASHQCGVTGLDDLIRSGLKWLDAYLSKSLSELKKSKEKEWMRYEMETNAFVFRVLSEASSLKVRAVSSSCMETCRRLFDAKNKLTPYGLALLGMGMHYLGDDKCCEEIIHNLRQYEMNNAENQTAWLNLRGTCSWFWFDDENEAHAIFIKLMALRTPQDEFLPWHVKYLLNNRRHGAYWKSTRDTAMCLDALATYVLNSGETECEMHVELNLDGHVVASSDLTPNNLVDTSSLILDGEAISDGKHELGVVKSGKGALYVSASLGYFSLEEFIGEAGLDIKVRRTMWRLIREEKTMDVPDADGSPAAMKTERFRREALVSGEAVESGDLLEVELVLESLNDYEYLLLEDRLAAGTTPFEAISGYNGNSLGAYVEYHDNRVSFFIHNLLRGQYSLSYRLRAEVPGSFSALPAKITAMY